MRKTFAHWVKILKHKIIVARVEWAAPYSPKGFQLPAQAPTEPYKSLSNIRLFAILDPTYERDRGLLCVSQAATPTSAAHH